LISVGVDVRQCLNDPVVLSSACKQTKFRALVEHVCGSAVHTPNAGRAGSCDDVSTDSEDEKCCLFSLTKLLDSVFSTADSRAADSADLVFLSSSNALFSLASSPGSEKSSFSEPMIAACLRRKVASGVDLVRMQDTPYVLRRRLVRAACRVFRESLLVDGGRLSEEVRAGRYAGLAIFFLNAGMLREVLALRMTCKSNSERRRFPVCHVQYYKLEANVIEEWLAFESSRFVPTSTIYAVIALHELNDLMTFF
jgi:hypothetical protein